MNKKYYYSIPVTILYLALSFTGVFMFVHLETAGMEVVHQIPGVIFVIFGGIHLFMNWKIFQNYFSRSVTYYIGSALIAFTMILYIAGMQHGRNPIKTIAFKIPDAPISIVAGLIEIHESEAIRRLEAETGLEIHSGDSIHSIAEKNEKDMMELFDLLLQKKQN